VAEEIHIRVPASTANLGPGFDCLGMALGLYHRLTVVEGAGEGLEIRAHGEGAADVALDERNIVYRALVGVLRETDYVPGSLLLESHNDIPLACGLGSSAAALLAGLAAGLLLSGRRLDWKSLIELGTGEEGHPDNIVPCALGGFTVAVMNGGDVIWNRLEPPEQLKGIVAIPDFRLPTREAREALPQRVDFADAVANLGRVGLLVAGMAGGALELLRAGMEDRLHQPYRAELIPGMEEVRRAALGAGALGAALSGAGPAMLALVEGDGKEVGEAMEGAWKDRGVFARTLTLEVDREGLQGEIVGR
jgi:homoserine kinase